MSGEPAESARNRLEPSEFRAQLRAFLTEHHPGSRPRGADQALAWQRGWQATLVDHGWAGPSWPAEYGGMELPFELQVAYHEEIGRAKVPAALATGTFIAAPTIVRYGTDAQRGAGCGRCSVPTRSGHRVSPNRTPVPTCRRCDAAPNATATTT